MDCTTGMIVLTPNSVVSDLRPQFLPVRGHLSEMKSVRGSQHMAVTNFS
jgi:hypothetical protein